MGLNDLEIPEWLETRKSYLGGTDLGPLLRVDPFRTMYEVQLSKTVDLKLIETPPDAAANRQKRRGQFLQAALENIAEAERDSPLIRNVPTIFYPGHPFGANVDGLWANEDGGLEIKYCSPHSPLYFGETVREIPKHYYLQIVWYMGITGRSFWVLMVLYHGDIRYYVIPSDPGLFQQLVDFAGRWWERFVIQGVPVPIEASETASRWLQRAYPSHKRPDIRPAEDAEVALLDEYLWLRVNQRQQASERDDLEAALKLAIKDREGIRWQDGLVTWRKTKDGTTVEWESIARGLLNEYVAPDKRAEVLDFLLGLHTHARPGHRRLLLSSKFLKKETEEAADAA